MIGRADKKILFALVVSCMMFIATAPIIIGATSDSLEISFDPDGDVDIDVNFADYNITVQVGPVISGTWTNTSGSTFTIYNNGTVAMDTQIQTNTSTDQGNMSLNASGVAPAQDEYAINITGLSNGYPQDTYVHVAYGVEFDQNLAPSGGTATFDLCILLGDISANHTWQETTLNFTTTQS
jgi:hypothetical protein